MKKIVLCLSLLVVAIALGSLGWFFLRKTENTTADTPSTLAKRILTYQPQKSVDTGGFDAIISVLSPAKDPTSLESIRDTFANIDRRGIAEIDKRLAAQDLAPEERPALFISKAGLLMYGGDPQAAYDILQQGREEVQKSDRLAEKWLYSMVFFQGIAGLRRGEIENCLECRGDGACTFPIPPTAVHTKPTGSRLAIKHFTEYLEQFPGDLGVRWLLNLAYMTLGEYPAKVPAKFVMNFDRFGKDMDIGRFKDVAHRVGLARMNIAGGAVMDDFDNDGLLDIVTTSWDNSESMAYYRNQGDGTFKERTDAAGLRQQLGGLNLVQTDYNNDGNLDLFIMRGAWMPVPMRPSLLRNNGNGTFTDVTEQAGLSEPVNTLSASWADFDNDGFLDLFICCEAGPNKLYRNRGNGTFEEVAAKVGLLGKQKVCKGAAWIDYDNDGYPDLLVTYANSTPQLFHNNRNGTFRDVSTEMGIGGPQCGFACWAFDYDNDGFLDLFVTSYHRTVQHVVGGMQGQRPPSGMDVTRLYRNRGGKSFQDVSAETGVDNVFATMGSNFADFTNDGFLDFYLGTGDPSFAMVVPNRMFKNVSGKRFAEITTSSGTGHLQKGHGVACGDWKRDGNVDLFIELGGAVPGDVYHNVLFLNPGHGNNWLTVKLVGKKTNRAAIGARIKVVTDAAPPQTVHRHVSSGSSFGGNPLQQHIGLGKAKTVATLEVFWPTSQTTQVFHNIDANQAIEITEFAKEYRKLNWTPVKLPKE
ncbi:MAG: CRTAC1 family protein [Gemmataceae bacterium]